MLQKRIVFSADHASRITVRSDAKVGFIVLDISEIKFFSES
jgi:hypothetical protein